MVASRRAEAVPEPPAVEPSEPVAGQARDAAAELLGYCVLGARDFTECNGPNLTEAVEARLAAALEVGDGLDARVVLLTLHAGVIQSSVVERYGLEATGVKRTL